MIFFFFKILINAGFFFFLIPFTFGLKIEQKKIKQRTECFKQINGNNSKRENIHL